MRAPVTSKSWITAMLLSLAVTLGTSQAVAGNQKAKVKGSVKDVAEQVESAFEELEIETADSAVTSAHAMTVGKSKDGTRVTVSVNNAGKDECEITVSSDGPEDPEIEKRFMALMQSR